MDHELHIEQDEIGDFNESNSIQQFRECQEKSTEDSIAGTQSEESHESLEFLECNESMASIEFQESGRMEFRDLVKSLETRDTGKCKENPESENSMELEESTGDCEGSKESEESQKSDALQESQKHEESHRSEEVESKLTCSVNDNDVDAGEETSLNDSHQDMVLETVPLESPDDNCESGKLLLRSEVTFSCLLLL